MKLPSRTDMRDTVAGVFKDARAATPGATSRTAPVL
jgi:hypothetical protein